MAEIDNEDPLATVIRETLKRRRRVTEHDIASAIRDHLTAREGRINERLQLANRTEAMRDILREYIATRVAAGAKVDMRIQYALEALEVTVSSAPSPQWLIAVIRPDLTDETVRAR